jgi:prophage maintenance system killer protein
VRAGGEQFEEADDLDRVQHALSSVQNVSDPVEVAALLANRVTRAQGFAEGNKRTALLLARWVLDRNGFDGSKLIPADDRELAGLLVNAASGMHVEREIVALFRERERSTAT